MSVACRVGIAAVSSSKVLAAVLPWGMQWGRTSLGIQEQTTITQGLYARRSFATGKGALDTTKLRNIGISAHIDSGKTTLTERVLFYAGRIQKIHEVKGKDGVGATMDFMELERERGITIQSAATFCRWGDHSINIIDTPGHVDFTIEVERALRVLDGAILVLCSVGGVQSQSITVDRQMRRYKVPRLAFINKIDRMGANPWRVVDQLRSKLRVHAIPVQIPMGLENGCEGLVDLVSMQSLWFDGAYGEVVRVGTIPKRYQSMAKARRHEMIEKLGEVDDVIGEKFLMEEEPSVEEIQDGLRRATVANKAVPVFMGSALKNKGVQPLLDGVVRFLPNPTEVLNYGIDNDNNQERVTLDCDARKPFLGLAFKLEEGRYGQLTYFRVYQGVVEKGMYIYNAHQRKKVKLSRLVRCHADQIEDIQRANAGDIVALFGIDCATGDSFTDGSCRITMESMHVPDPVVSMAISPKESKDLVAFSKGLNRFSREDPTFRVHLDAESSETIISGMGELHLDIYTERMRREYNVETIVGRPKVNYRESIKSQGHFDFLHKKQSGGQGQYARVVGFVEPLPPEDWNKVEFRNDLIGQNIPPHFIPAIERGFREACEKGSGTGHPVVGLRFVLTDGAFHAVDSSELAFRIATINALRIGVQKAHPVILEPVMDVEIVVPQEYQSRLTSEINRRKGIITATEQVDGSAVIHCDVTLFNMFGFSADLRSSTQGNGEFSMEYKRHSAVMREQQEKLVAEYEKRRMEEIAKRK